MERPNIFLFVLDTARAENLSCYGYERCTTPFLNEVGREGTIFQNAFTNSIWTLPSHASIFTGMYPHEHGKISKNDAGEFYFETLPEILSQKGYDTLAFSNNGWISSKFGFEQIFDRFSFNGGNNDLLFEEGNLIKEFESKGESEWGSSLKKYYDFASEALKSGDITSLINGVYYLYKNKLNGGFWGDDGASWVLKELRKIDFGEDPNFVFANFIEPHAPYSPPKEYGRKYFSGDFAEAKEKLKIGPSSLLGEKNDQLAELFIDFYDAELAYLDDVLREIKLEIEDRTERKNIFIYVGDHGEMFSQRGLWEHHGGFDESVLKVPLLISGVSDRNIEDIFELKDLKEAIVSLSEGEEEYTLSEKAYSEYLGVNSHVFNLTFDDRFDKASVAEITESGISSFDSLEESPDRVKEHLRELFIKKNRNNI